MQRRIVDRQHGPNALILNTWVTSGKPASRAAPLVDSGLEPAPSFPFWYLTDIDAREGVRDVQRIDIGAFDTDRLFRSGFDPALLLP